MTAYSERRPTRDIDLAAFNDLFSVAECEKRIRDIASISLEDGLLFDLNSISGETIRDRSVNRGVRVSLAVNLAKANINFHIDMNYGDPIKPEPVSAALPLLLGGGIEVLAYPVTMLLVEKIVTILDRGTANTRWRDFLDILSISQELAVDGNDLMLSIETVSTYRSVELKQISIVLDGIERISQAKWSSWRKRQRLEDLSPDNLADLVDKLDAFASPAINGLVKGKVWDPVNQAWGRQAS